MRKLAYSVDSSAVKLEASIPGMIQTTLVDDVTRLSVTINTFVARIALCYRSQGTTKEVTSFKAAIAALRRDSSVEVHRHA